MKKIFFAFMLVILFAGNSVLTDVAVAGHLEERYVREEAERRNIKLISVEEAQEIVMKKINAHNMRFKETELEDEANDYPNAINFRPVYQIECLCEKGEYDIDIDAVTGKILKFELDD